MASYEITNEPEGLRAPALIVSFEDWVDAGAAGTTAARHIAEGGEAVVRFDPDGLFDYRSHRPVLDIVDGKPNRFVMPTMTMIRRSLPERDVFVLTGPEPDYRWQEFTSGVHEVATRFGIIEHVSLGAIPAAVPHTAPTPVMMTASNPDLMHDATPTAGLLRVPAAAVSMIEWTFAEAGIPAVGFWAQVPHYAAQFAAGAIALVRKVERHLSVTIGAGELEEQAATQGKALVELFSDNPEAQEYLERLQSAVEENLPGAENIGEEVERFLRYQRPDGGPTPFSP